MRNNTLFRLQGIASLLFILLCGLDAYADGDKKQSKNHTVDGSVFDAQSKQPIEYASVALFNETNDQLIGGGITDEHGKYSIDNVNEGHYYLQIKFVGFKELTSPTFTIEAGLRKYKATDLFLQQDISELENIEVIGKKQAITYKMDKKVIDAASVIAADGGTAVNIIERVPSIAIDVEGNITLRGSSSFRVIIDGRPTLLTPSMALGQIQASEVDNIEIITNPSARYDAQGEAGIVNVILKKGSGKGLSGVVSANTSTVGT